MDGAKLYGHNFCTKVCLNGQVASGHLLTIHQLTNTTPQFRTKATEIPPPVFLPCTVGVYGSFGGSPVLNALAAD